MCSVTVPTVRQDVSLISYTSVSTVIRHALEDWDTGVRYLSGSQRVLLRKEGGDDTV